MVAMFTGDLAGQHFLFSLLFGERLTTRQSVPITILSTPMVFKYEAIIRSHYNS